MDVVKGKVPSRYVAHLFRFMSLFDINRFAILGTSKTSIIAKVGWADDGSPHYDESEEVQDIIWDIQYFKNIEDALELGEFLKDNKLLNGDRITIAKDDLASNIGWTSQKIYNALKTLLNIKVDMLDDGKKSDYFFLHF
ncbi:hypothetical protein [Sneathiella sp. HT1-7]|uniref:hypothetical protein n=1 Tax=Sneathiella sp. HT1-7 TaxID=2887192 RepID=UPI001D154B6D|nr:hypothetical protein [Sneathiella sp. HT1-7]MCC3304843.1 hypothetical protein [Sneathiella sp. HT1-7]